MISHNQGGNSEMHSTTSRVISRNYAAAVAEKERQRLKRLMLLLREPNPIEDLP